MQVQTMTRGAGLDMAYETKVILIAIAKIIRKADNIKEIYEAIEEMANAEGVVLQPLDGKETKPGVKKISAGNRKNIKSKS